MLGQGQGDHDNDEAETSRRDENNAHHTMGAGCDDSDELRRVIEESKRSLAVEQARRADDADLAMAIKLSEEEIRQKAALTDSGSLFDEP